MLVSHLSLGKHVGEPLPEINRRVRSPRSDSCQIKIWVQLDHAFENQIRPRKSIGVTDGAKADIFRRPGTQAFRFEEGLPERHGVLSFGERNRSTQYAAAEIANRLSSTHRCLDLTEIGLRQNFRAGK